MRDKPDIYLENRLANIELDIKEKGYIIAPSRRREIDNWATGYYNALARRYESYSSIDYNKQFDLT